MGSISHSIGPKLGFHHQVSHCSPGLFGLSRGKFLSLSSRKHFGRIHASIDVKDGRKIEAIDFSDPDWKLKYQADFEKRFNLPHITDVFGDAVPIPSTFCLRMRCCFLFLSPLFGLGCVFAFFGLWTDLALNVDVSICMYGLELQVTCFGRLSWSLSVR